MANIWQFKLNLNYDLLKTAKNKFTEQKKSGLLRSQMNLISTGSFYAI